MLCVYDEGRLVGSLGNEEVETERYYKRQEKQLLRKACFRSTNL